MSVQSTLARPRGPAGNWAPRDDSVLDAAQTRLRHSAYLELRRVQCDCQDGVLTLEGAVSSHYLRQVAQATVQGLYGIVEINNSLEVVPCCLTRDGWGSE